MGVTTKYALRYPERSDVPDVQVDLKNLATDVDNAITAGLPVDTVVPAATRLISNKLLAGDANPAWRLMGDGSMQWGAGGTTALDTSLYRSIISSVPALRTDSNFLVGNPATAAGLNLGPGGGIGSYRSAVGFVLRAHVVGDAQDRFYLDSNGAFQWGDGTNALDVSLSRSGQYALKLNADFQIDAIRNYGGAIQILAPSGGITFGGDTVIQRIDGAGFPTFGMNSMLRLGYDVIARQGYGGGSNNSQVRVGQVGVAGYPAGLTFGSSEDTNLYRYAPGQLKTDGSFFSAKSIAANLGDANNQILLETNGVLYFGSANDTYLWRLAAGAFGVQGGIYIQNAPLNIGVSFNPPDFNPNRIAFQSTVTGEIARWYVTQGGVINWGPGGSTQPDTNLYRYGVSILRSEGALDLASWLAVNDGGDAYRVIIGQINGWVGGVARAGIIFGSANDTNLYRTSANTLKTDGYLQVSGGLYSNYGQSSQIALGGSVATIYFGSGFDAVIYRLNAGQLKTDGDFIVGQSFTATGNPATALGRLVVSNQVYINSNVLFHDGTNFDTNLYRAAAASLKTDGSFSAGGQLRTSTYVITNDDGAYPPVGVGYDFNGNRFCGIGFSYDLSLYRWGAGILATNGGFYVAASDNTKYLGALISGDANLRWSVRTDGVMQWSSGSAAADIFMSRVFARGLQTNAWMIFSVPSDPTAYAISTQLNADAQVRFAMRISGAMSWGDGTNAMDTTLQRGYAGALYAGTAAGAGLADFYAGRFVVSRGSSPAEAIRLQWSADSTARFLIQSDGYHSWGPGGAAAGDVNLYRGGVGLLNTDTTFQAAGGIYCGGSLFVGTNSGLDTYLFRAAAGVLKANSYVVQANTGTSFPASPVDGQEYNYVADVTNGVVWKYIYSTSAGKWRFVGGPPLMAYVAAQENATATTYGDLATPGPSIALPFAGDFDIGIACQIQSPQGDKAAMSMQVGATAAGDPDALTTSPLPAGPQIAYGGYVQASNGAMVSSFSSGGGPPTCVKNSTGNFTITVPTDMSAGAFIVLTVTGQSMVIGGSQSTGTTFAVFITTPGSWADSNFYFTIYRWTPPSPSYSESRMWWVRKTGISGTVSAKYRTALGGSCIFRQRWLYIRPVQK